MAGYPLNDNTAYAKAETVLSGIMEAVEARFAANFADIFDVTKENKYDLFSVQFASGNQGLGSSMAAYVTSSGSNSTSFPEWAYSGYGQQGQDFRLDDDLVDQMKEDGDRRFETSIAEGFWKTTTHGTIGEDPDNYTERRIIIKFLTKDNTNSKIKAWNDYPLNYPILRPADAYLLYAESLLKNNKVSDAATWLNKIRARAGLSPITNPTIDDIMKERRREFLGEGKRYFDLVRMGEETFVSTLTAFANKHPVNEANTPAKRDMLLPIPRTVMNIHTAWEQNYGY
jgi:hypothetical protein